MSDEIDRATVGVADDAWLNYLERLDGVRPDLFRYFRRLTGNPWDAEDLVQDTLEQGFARLSLNDAGVDNPRAYVLRIASNIWISRQRRARRERALADTPELAPNAGRDAAPDGAPQLHDAGPRCSDGSRRRNAPRCCSRRSSTSRSRRSPMPW